MKAVLLECTLDDITGEELAHAIESIVKGGAADAHALFGIGKKGRPVFVLRVVCAEKDRAAFAKMMARETGTMGVKKFPFGHVDFPKRVQARRTAFGVLHSKSTGMSSKYEYEELRRKSKETGMPLRELAKKLKRKNKE
ncbi:Uncharacterised protein [uncultured archaeon]|nr:Uncharacterised protein [uncultured archaeon]